MTKQWKSHDQSCPAHIRARRPWVSLNREVNHFLSDTSSAAYKLFWFVLFPIIKDPQFEGNIYLLQFVNDKEFPTYHTYNYNRITFW